MSRRNYWVAVALLLIFFLGGCGAISTETPSGEMILQDIQTYVAQTVTAQVTNSVPPTTTPPPTVAPTVTAILPSATAQIVYSYIYPTCADSEYIKDMTIPDETVLSPGEEFVKTWKLENTGNCSWTSDFSMTFVKGNDMSGSDTEIDQSVRAGKRGDISVSLVAPDEEGTYIGYWRLVDAYGQSFGDIVRVEIIVEEEEATSTPTAASTPTATATPTYTLTPTDLPTPTSAATQTPTPIITAESTETETPITTESTETETPITTELTEIDTPIPTYTEFPTEVSEP